MKTLITLAALYLLAYATPIQAQETEDSTPYWYVTTYEVPWANVDSLQQLVEEYTIPAVELAIENGTLLDYHVLVHHTGAAENVVILEKYPSWVGLETRQGLSEAFRELVPDAEERSAVRTAYGRAFGDAKHSDSIYYELTHVSAESVTDGQ